MKNHAMVNDDGMIHESASGEPLDPKEAMEEWDEKDPVLASIMEEIANNAGTSDADHNVFLSAALIIQRQRSMIYKLQVSLAEFREAV